MDNFFSIITVVLNAKEDLADSIQSLKEQSFKKFEYIVIDGNSTAGSKELRLAGSNSVNDDITITQGAGIELTSSSTSQLGINAVSLQQFEFTAGDGSNYTVSGSGLLTAGENDPQLFVYRGHTYRFRHTIAANGHPLEIVLFGTGTAPAADYISSTNATRNLATTNDIITFTIPMNAATGNTYQYRCTAHPSNMLGTITVV